MPVQEISDLDIESRRALAAAAGEFAAEGALGDTVLADAGACLPDVLAARLNSAVRPPDPGVGYRVVRGLFTEFGDQGPTPLHWRETDRERCAPFDIGLAMVASLVGRVFGWADQQDGRIVHNILPSPGCEEMQIGASSTTPLAWHTEDAFHPDRADLLLLACVRNPDAVGSRLSTVASAKLGERDIGRLLEPQVVILPDDSYEDDHAELRERIGMATLWPRRGSLGLRYDPSYTQHLTEDAAFRAAYQELGRALEDGSFIVPLAPGDLLIIDNDAAVHGRVAFQPRYDGTDRWLKRVLVRSPQARPEREQREHGYQQRQVDAYRTQLPLPM
ncbi:TauD/TfdA family dioxygenase [Streptomyces sp. NPDC020681]|uniref:TauD/TfdA family dioxygenase n=1 Tax=Streptomyces sp. NPDC020681 TaxID=3365083 RepID=UPI0037A1FF5C